MVDEYKFTVLFDEIATEAYLRIPKETIIKFNRSVLAYVELQRPEGINGGVKKISIQWPSEIYPYIINPSNVVFEVDGQIIIQQSVYTDINNKITEHIISLSNQFNTLKIYIFDDQLAQNPVNCAGFVSDIKECNSFEFQFPRAYNSYPNTECSSFEFQFPRSYNVYPNTECNSFQFSFPRAYNSNVTTECVGFQFNFPRSYDYSILLE